MSIPSQSGAEENRKLVALLYHELRTEPAAYSYVLPLARFQDHLRLFDALAATASVPVVTFDDGHLSNYTHALPALESFGRKAHFFITAGWTGTRQQYMEPHHLRALHDAGHTVGAHGWTHTLLTQCDGPQLEHELRDARAALEDYIGAAVTSLSLPGGRSDARVLSACRDAGYQTVWTSVPGAIASVAQPLAGRFNILAGHTDDLLRRLLDPSGRELARASQISRCKAAAQRIMGDRMYARLWALLNRKEGTAEDPAAMEMAPAGHSAQSAEPPRSSSR